MKYPIIADPNKEIIPQLNMIDPIENGPSRALHIVGPDSKVIISYIIACMVLLVNFGFVIYR